MDKEQKLKELALSVVDGTSTSKEINKLLSSLDMSKKDLIEGYLLYNLDISIYANEIYEHKEVRFAMYLQNLMKGSWHIKRHEIVLNILKELKSKSIVDMGFGLPSKYMKEYVLENEVKLKLVDFYDSAFNFSEKLFDIWGKPWKEKISFKSLDMNKKTYVGNFDCYLFMDSIEHINNPEKYLKKFVKKSNPGTNFIISLPIGPLIPSHTRGWKTEKEAIKWLSDCDLIIDKKENVYPNPKVDLFAAETNNEIYDIIFCCSKKYDIANLPLLDEVKNLNPEINLKNTLLIVCHHILISNLILLDYIIKLGINPRDVFLIGKSYSTCNKTLEDYKKLGVNVDENSFRFDSHISFDKQFSKHIKKFLKNIINQENHSNYERILILDDGGGLLIQANELFASDKRVVGVEQTSSGYHRVNKLELNFPIINVARSRAKLDHETPMIVEAFSKELYKRLRQMDRKIENILVIGNGPVGAGIAEDLREDYEVFVYDKDREKSEISEKDFIILLTGCDLIIGCSGETGVLKSFYPILKRRVILASVSSSDREFEGYKIRKKHEKISNTHKDFHTEEVILLNGGFPLNFDGHKLCVPLEKIQLTEALMFAAAIQAIQTSYEKNIIDLDSKTQDFIIERFEELD